MERLERLVVHVEEANALSERQDVASQRLALLLFDSAAELLLHREVEHRLAMNEWLRGMAHAYEQHEAHGFPLDEDAAAHKAELDAQVLSQTRARRIRETFNAKLDFLVEVDALTQPLSRVLVKLHRYRNEAYHRDTVRSETIHTAVAVYRYATLVLMTELPPHMMSWLDRPPTVIAKYFQGEAHLGLEAQRQIAEALLVRLHARRQAGIAQDLHDHVHARLDELEDALDFIVDFFDDMTGGEKWDREAALRSAQLPQQTDPRMMTTDDFRSLDVPVRGEDLVRWRAAAERIVEAPDQLAAFSAFADLEDEFEPTEDVVLELAREIDRHIQLEIDIARGK